MLGWFLQVATVYAGGQGSEMVCDTAFVPGAISLLSLSLWATLWDEQITLPPVCPQFQTAGLCCTCMGCLFCCLFKGGVSLTSWPQGFPRAKLADFENSRSLSPAVFQNSQNLVLLFFKGKYDEDLSSMFVSIQVWKPVFCSSPCCRLPPNWGRPWSTLLPDSIFTLPTFFDTASSLPLVVESILPVFGLFPGSFMLIWMLSSCNVSLGSSYSAIFPADLVL